MYIDNYKKTILDNGITVISEKIDSVRSIAVGIWIKAGSRFEEPSQNGIAHFLEHMTFKGTSKRSALKIAQSLESLGGTLNAFTSKEITCYYANVLDIHLKKAIEVLADIVCDSVYPEKEINKERMVVLEEINSVKDTPEEYIFDIFQEKLFPDNSLGRPILGDEKIVKSFERAKVLDFWQKHYLTQNIVISAAGNLDHNKLVKLIDSFFHFPANPSNGKYDEASVNHSKEYILDRPINQAHFCVGGESISYESEDRIPLLILNTYLGGGMSSRLFQKIREQRGLAYTIYSFMDLYSDLGLFGVYAGTDPDKISQLKELLEEEFNLTTKKQISDSVLSRLKNQLKGNLVLGLENTSRRMSRLAKNELYLGEYISLDSLINNIDKVTSEDVYDIANQVIQPNKFVSVILKPSKN